MNEPPNKRIVVIEDNPPDVLLLEVALQEAGVEFDLVSLGDGEQARTYIHNGAPKEPPDLFLVDLNLPILSGIEVLELIRREPSISNVPIIVWSSIRDNKDLEPFGIKQFFTKPSSLEAFVQIGHVIREILHQ